MRQLPPSRGISTSSDALMGRNVMTPEVEREVLRARAEGLSFATIGIRVGFSESTCWRVVQRYGDPLPRLPQVGHASVERAVREHSEVTIEAGASGGYIATVAGKYTGMEHRTIRGAIRSAMMKALRAED